MEDTVTSAMMISNTAVSVGGLGQSGCGDFPAKKKRGRPRKYHGNGNIKMTASVYQEEVASSSLEHLRGPIASENSKVLASLGALLAVKSGGKLTPHAITINAGENITEKITSFCQKGPMGVCVLSTTGAIASATLHHPLLLTSLTYEGLYEIVSLTGSYTVTQTNTRIIGQNRGDLNVMLASSDGKVISGSVSGPLIAATRIQAVLGTFVPRKKENPHVFTSNTAVTVPESNQQNYLFPARRATVNFGDNSTH